MADVSIKQRKKILHDPVVEYLQQHPQATDGPLSALAKLHQQHADINRQLKDYQNLSKKISRQIGEAKRKSRSSGELLQVMRQHSNKCKALKDQVNDLAKRILNYFESCDAADKTRNQTDDLLPARVHIEYAPAENQVSIALLNNEHAEWNRYAESNPAASLYHRAEWKNLIHDVFGHECYYFYATHNEEMVGILPLVRLNSRLFGDFIVSMPYFNSGGAIANNLLIEQQLMQAANEHAEKIGSHHIEYRDDISRDKLPVRDEKVNMILSLPNLPETLWQNFSSKLRSQIRRAQREDITVNIGSIDCLDDFYTVFAQNMRDLGTPVYSKSFFSHILQTFPDHSKIVIVQLNGRPVATAFLLGHNKTLEIPWASTIKNVNHLSINMLLYWEVLKFAVENRYRYFDFGRSSKDSGTFRFKQQWGAKPKQCYWHYWLKGDAKLPSLNPNNPKYKLMISVWKRIPVSITKWIGPGIVKNLP